MSVPDVNASAQAAIARNPEHEGAAARAKTSGLALSAFDDIPDVDAGAAWHQEQFCEHADLAFALRDTGGGPLAEHHWRIAAWHRGQAAELTSA